MAEHEKYIEQCLRCKGAGFVEIKGDKIRCLRCHGEGKKIYVVSKITDYFRPATIANKYDTEVFHCNNCEKAWFLPDCQEYDERSFNKEMLRCECGQLIDITCEWVRELRINADFIIEKE